MNPINIDDSDNAESEASNAKRETPNAERNPSLIHLSDVKKVFLTDEVETHALDGIYLDIHPGEYVAIAGPSGCGKSTLLSILGLLDSPSGGQYLLNGQIGRAHV